MVDWLILLIVLSGILTFMGHYVRSRPIVMLSSFAWMITGLQIITTDETIPSYTILFFIAIAVSVYFLVGRWK